MIPIPQGLETLRKILKKKGITHDHLAFALGTSGPRVCRVLKGYLRFTPGERAKIARLLNVSERAAFKEAVA